MWQRKHLYFLGEKSKLQPMSSSLGNDKFLFGMLYINLLKLVWFRSRIWEFYKFWSFKSWGFGYLCLGRLILILHLKCFLFRFMCFFCFPIKSYDFWLINYLFGLISINCLFGFNIKIMELGIIILILFHVLNCLYSFFFEKIVYIVITMRKSYCYFLISWFLFIYLQFILVLSVCIYNYWEFCFINLRIVNYFVSFGNYVLATQ